MCGLVSREWISDGWWWWLVGPHKLFSGKIPLLFLLRAKREFYYQLTSQDSFSFEDFDEIRQLSKFGAHGNICRNFWKKKRSRKNGKYPKYFWQQKWDATNMDTTYINIEMHSSYVSMLVASYVLVIESFQKGFTDQLDFFFENLLVTFPPY
jgi:hypothetical protein